MGDERTYNVEDRIRELGETPETAYANASANGMAGDAPPPTPLPADPFPSVNPFADKGADPSAAGEPPPPPASGKAGSAPVMAPRPAPPKLAPIVDTGTLADTQEKMPELVPVRPTTAPIEPAASFGDLFAANRNIAERSSSLFDERMLHDGYAPIVRLLGLPPSENPAMFNQVDAAGEARFGSMGSPSDLATAAKQGESVPFGNTYLADRPLQESLIVAQIKARRAKDPNFAPGVPDTVDGLHKYFIDQQKHGEATDQAVIARSPGGLTGFGAALAGSAVGTMEDPVNIMALAIPGGEGKSLLQIAARDAIINGVLEFAQQPIVAHNKAELGESYTATDAATNVASAAIGGAVLGPALHIGGKAIGATGIPQAIGGAVGSTVGTVAGLFKALPEAVRTKWAGRAADGAPVGSFFSSLDNRELAEFARDASGGKLTPDQSAAANVIERAQEVGESSPYQPGPAGDGTHEGALASAIKDLEDRRTPEAAGLPSGPAADGTGVASPAATLERPPAPSTVGRPQPSTDVESAIASFTPKVYHAENATGNVNAKNPHSSASGPAQFTDGTFRDYYRKVYGQDPGEHPAQELKNNPEVQGRLLNALTRDNAAKLQALHEPLNDGNLYVMHVFGAHDGEKIFKADPSTPIDELLSAKAIEGNRLEGKSASEVIAWAHGRMGVPHVAAVRASAGPLEAASEDPTIAQLNSDALQLDNAVIGSDAQSSTWSPRTDTDAAVAATQPVPPMYARSYPAREINVDADRFQFKAGGDQQGVTDRLNGVSQWNPLYAGRIVTWEDQAGRVFVADGHQRVGLANRLERQGHPPISMDAITLREADGVSAEDARTYAALKNIAEGTGTSIDAAKVIRDAGPHVLDHLPPKSALVRDGGALARLSDRAFGAVYNDVVPADFAAVIGHLLPHQPEAHEAMIDLLAKLDPANRGQAESIVRQAMAAGIHKEEQVDLFGTHEHVTSLMLEKAKITERVLAQLRKMRLVHRTAAEGADALEAAGSTIARERSAEEAQANAQAIETVNRLAYRAGPVSDAITAAARELKSGGQLGSLARTAAERIRELDLADLGRDVADGSDVGALAGETAVDHADGANIDGAGRGGDAGEEGPQSSAEHGDQEQPSLLELEHATERFSDPDGKAVQQQADSLTHDLKADVSRRDQIHAATEALKDTKPGELRAVEPFTKDEPGYHRFRYVAEDGTAVGGSYTIDGDTIENLNIGDMSNRAELGPAQVRAMLEQLHEQNPEVRFVHGYRKSGGRKAVGAGEKDVWFEFTSKGAKFHGDTDPRQEPAAAFARFKDALDGLRLVSPASDDMSDREVAEIFANDALSEAVNEHAVKLGRQMDVADEAAGEQLHKKLTDLALGEAAGDRDRLKREVAKAIKDGSLPLEDLGEPELVGPNTSAMERGGIPDPVRPMKSADYAGPEISPDEAQARVADWKAEAQRIGRESPPPPNHVLISLFDASGVWSKPYEEMGYKVVRLDLKGDHDLLREMGGYMLAIDQAKADGLHIAGVLAQPPCTTFASSGARWWGPRHNRSWDNALEKMFGPWAAKNFESPVEYNQFLVAATEEYIHRAGPDFYAIENPNGRIAELTGLPKPQLVMQPHHFGDPYTKWTNVYGKFNPELETANVHPSEGSRAHNLRGRDEKEDGARSVTPEGFAYAFALANHPGAGEDVARAAGEHAGEHAAAPEGAQLLGGEPATDPAIADRQRQQVELKAGSPMRSIEEQHGTMGLGLFDHSDQPDLTFRIGEEGREVTAADLLKDLEEDDKAIKAIKDCL